MVQDEGKKQIDNAISPGGFCKGEESLWEEAVKTILYVTRSNAKKKIPIFIQGGTGTGKTYVAEHILHKMIYSKTPSAPFKTMPCAICTTAGTFRSEMFGYEKGAFTGANPKGYTGIVKEAEGGTLFFDEVDKILPVEQTALLDFVERRKFRPLHSKGEADFNGVLIFASNKDIDKLVFQESFLEDLCNRIYRPGSIIRLPAVMERYRSIDKILKYFWEHDDILKGHPFPLLLGEIARQTTLLAYDTKYRFMTSESANLFNEVRIDLWPKNLRDMQNLVNMISREESYEMKRVLGIAKSTFIENIEAKRNIAWSTNNDNILNHTVKFLSASRWNSKIDELLEKAEALFGPDYPWWFRESYEDIKKQIKCLEINKKLSYHKEASSSCQDICSIRWQGGTRKEILEKFCKLRYEYNRVFKGMTTEEETAKDIGITRQTLSKYLKK